MQKRKVFVFGTTFGLLTAGAIYILGVGEGISSEREKTLRWLAKQQGAPIVWSGIHRRIKDQEHWERWERS